MLWLFFAIFSYFLFAITTIIDKFLLNGPIPNPKIYSFYVGIFSIFALLLIPLGFSIPEPSQIFLSLGAGAISIFALYSLYCALWRFEPSRIIPALGGLLPIFTFCLSYIIFQEKMIEYKGILAFLLLILGAILINLEIPHRFSQKSGGGFKALKIVFVTAFLFSLFFILAKIVYTTEAFWSGFIWMRLGAFLAALFFLLSPEVKKEIFKHRNTFKKKTASIFLLNQGLGAGAFMSQNFAVFLVPFSLLAFVNALQGIQYIFILIFTIFLSLKIPHILKEKFSKRILFQKILAVFLIGLGLFLLC